MRVDQALRQARARLAASPTAALDAELLLGQVLGRSRTWLYTWPEHDLDPAQRHAFQALLTRRERGEPVAYLLGEREFYGRRFRVNADVLIPRPDTETLVDMALTLLPATPLRVADLGTGSGAIGITLALERPAWRVLLVDCSEAALTVAGDNAARLGANVDTRCGSWLEGETRDFDLIVSNPPYIDADDHHLSEGDVRFEPRSALVAGEQGLADLSAIAAQARRRLNPGGWLMLEHGHQQGGAVRELLRRQGFTGRRSRRDLGGNERVTLGHV